MAKQNRNTRLFIGFFLLAGIANLISRFPGPFRSTLMTCINYLTFIGLLLFWIEAVRVRLLPSPARTSMLSASLLMLLYMMLRIFKYRFAASAAAMRYAVYAYWIPQLLIPALFLITCIRIRRGGQEIKRQRENLLLLPAAVLALLAMTSDLHQLVYTPRVGLSEYILNTGTYGYGPVFWLMNGWMIGTAAAGLVLLARSAGHRPKKALRLLVVMVALWLGLILLNMLVLDRLPGGFHMFNNPEIHIFGLLGVFEICIRHHLIPCNENYTGFFRKLQIPSVIADKAFRPVYTSEASLPEDPGILRDAVKAPVSLTPEQKLYGKAIRAGYAFWAEDESAVHRAQERLLEANEMIEQENDLIQAETEQKEKNAYLQSRHRIYHEIAEDLYPCQKRITQLLNEAVPGTEDFKEKIAAVSVLNAYVKRKTNLLLLAAEKEYLSINELFLALQESASYLSLAGLKTTAREPEKKALPAAGLIALYDAFETLAEQLPGKAPSLMVSWTGSGLRLAAETDAQPDIAGISLPVRLRKSEGVLYMDIPAGEEAAV